MQVSIDTACSSALVAVHTAAQTLHKHGGSALAGAVNAMLAESTTAAAFTAGMLTSDGRCKTLDATADGYVRAEGCFALRLDIDLDSNVGTGAILAGTFVNQVTKTCLAHAIGKAMPSSSMHLFHNSAS